MRILGLAFPNQFQLSSRVTGYTEISLKFLLSGYIDKSGKMVIAPRKLFRADDFRNGLAFVTTEDRGYGYIDKTGKYVWTPTPLYADTKLLEATKHLYAPKY